jgi:DNA-directed RNA polymerase subunit K/omega
VSEASKKKGGKTAAAPEENKAEWTLSHLLLDQSSDKYRLVPLAVRWAYEVRQRDQSALPPQELVGQALREILTGQVKLEEIEALPPVPKDTKSASAPLAPLAIDKAELKEEEKEEKETETKGKKSKS